MDINDKNFFNYANAPEELRNVAVKTHAAFMRLRKAQDQVQLWTKEIALAEKEHHAIQQTFFSVLNRWDPSTNLIKQLEDFEACSTGDVVA